LCINNFWVAAQKLLCITIEIASLLADSETLMLRDQVLVDHTDSFTVRRASQEADLEIPENQEDLEKI